MATTASPSGCSRPNVTARQLQRSLQPARLFLGRGHSLLTVAGSRQPAGRARCVLVFANELNRWADRGGMDDDAGFDPNQFDRETGAVVLRVLTARATQKLLWQLQELDIFGAQWLNNWCSEHPPTEGNKFVLNLFQARGTVVTDDTTRTSHKIDPQNLAHRIIQIRTDMANNLSLGNGLAKYVEVENTTLLRTHLERATYVSGGQEDGNAGFKRRGYYRPRK